MPMDARLEIQGGAIQIASRHTSSKLVGMGIREVGHGPPRRAVLGTTVTAGCDSTHRLGSQNLQSRKLAHIASTLKYFSTLLACERQYRHFCIIG